MLLCVPAQIVYDACKNAETIRDATDFHIKATIKYTKDVPNQLLAATKSNSRGQESVWEWTLHELSKKSCQLTLKVEYDDRNEKRMKSYFESNLQLLSALEYGYRRGLLENIRTT